MMTHTAEQSNSLSTPAPGAAMDRKVEKKKVPWWRDRRFLIPIALVGIAILGWRAIPASGSTDVAADELQTARVERAVLADLADRGTARRSTPEVGDSVAKRVAG